MAKTDYEWMAAGEEWSEPWGGWAGQWFGSILPRIQGALPANTILEIGSVFGRWSHYQREHCTRLYLVDPGAPGADAQGKRLGVRSSTRSGNDGRFVSPVGRAIRLAVSLSGARKLAGTATDRLLFDDRTRGIETESSHPPAAKPRFHAGSAI